MIIAGAAEGSFGLRDHIATSFLVFSTGKFAGCFVISGEVMIGDGSSGGDIEGTSGGCGIGSDTGTDSDTGSDTGSVTGSDTGSGVGARAGSKTGSGAGSGTGSDICSTS